MPIPKTEAQKRAQKNYMSKFVEVKVRMTSEQRAQIQEHAQSQNESVTSFIKRAIAKQIEQDNTPADGEVPNAETIEAFDELDSGGGHSFSGSTTDLLSK